LFHERAFNGDKFAMKSKIALVNCLYYFEFFVNSRVRHSHKGPLITGKPPLSKIIND
jgi:hypothetical protein